MRTVIWVAAGLMLGLRSVLGTSYAYVPPEILLDGAELVVAGRMTEVSPEEGTGVVRITEVLKGDKRLQSVRVQFSKVASNAAGVQLWRGGGVMMVQARPLLPMGPRFSDGQAGVWVLDAANRTKEGGYRITTPMQYRREQDVDSVKDTLARLEKLPWSKPVNGLASRVLLHRPGRSTYFLICHAVKNAGDKPLRVCRYSGYRLVSAEVGREGGAADSIDLYGNLESRRLRPVAEQDFVVLKPGQTAYLPFPYGFNSGKREAGKSYKVRVVYTYPEDVSGLKLEGVWTGTVKAPEAEIRLE
jgi:hypothetical protein